MILLKDFNQKLKFFGSNNASSQRCLQLIISNEGKGKINGSSLG